MATRRSLLGGVGLGLIAGAAKSQERANYPHPRGRPILPLHEYHGGDAAIEVRRQQIDLVRAAAERLAREAADRERRGLEARIVAVSRLRSPSAAWKERRMWELEQERSTIWDALYEALGSSKSAG